MREIKKMFKKLLPNKMQIILKLINDELNLDALQIYLSFWDASFNVLNEAKFNEQFITIRNFCLKPNYFHKYIRISFLEPYF